MLASHHRSTKKRIRKCHIIHAGLFCSLSPHVARIEAALTRLQMSALDGRIEGRDLWEGQCLGLGCTQHFSSTWHSEILTEELPSGDVKCIPVSRCQSQLVPRTELWRTRVQEMLNYIGTEIHQTFWPVVEIPRFLRKSAGNGPKSSTGTMRSSTSSCRRGSSRWRSIHHRRCPICSS